MPPPNHHTGSAPSFFATNMRTLRWTVGAYGLRGWSTSETPIASQLRPDQLGARSGRRRRQAVAAHVGEADARRARTRCPPRSATTSRRRPRARPFVAPERLAVDRLERSDDRVLQRDEPAAGTSMSMAGSAMQKTPGPRQAGRRGGCYTTHRRRASALLAAERAKADVAAVLHALEADRRRSPRRRPAAPGARIRPAR